MKDKIKYFFMAAMLAFVFGGLFVCPVSAKTVETASNLEELAVIVNKHCMDRDTDFSVKYTGSKNDMKYVCDLQEYAFFFKELLLADDPAISDDADYVSGNLDFSTNKHDVYYENSTIYFKLRYFETLEQTKYVNEKVPGILKKLGVDKMSNYEKVKAIHDYVCDLITYKDSKKDFASVSSMYGAIANGKALCNAYALCVYKLLVEAGVPCKIIYGEAGTGRDSGGHAWNIVALGDKWYYIDTTWDDAPEENKNVEYFHEYFLKGSSDFDSFDTSNKHSLDVAYKSDEFTSAFPMAKKAFDPKTMSDVNKTVTIGNTAYKSTDTDKDKNNSKNEEKDTDKDKDKGKDYGKYSWDDIVGLTDPDSYSFSVKRGKMISLYLFFYDDMNDYIKNVSYKVTSGKSRLKDTYDSGIYYDDEYSAAILELRTRYTGNVKIKITITLTNGQKISHLFKVKIK